MSDENQDRQAGPARAGEAGEAPRELALDLTSEAVRLVARSPRGAWTEVCAVPLAAGDVRAALQALRRQAEALGDLPVTLWLPPDQILVRRYVLKRGDRRAEALRRLAEDTGTRAHELTITLSPAADGALVTVLGTSRRTVAEAVAYARRWGFQPSRVSTQVEAERFGAAGPQFALPDPAPRRRALSTRRALAAAAAMLAIGLAGWGAYGLLPVSEPAAPVVAEAPASERKPASGDIRAAGRVAPSSPSDRRLAQVAEPPAAARPPAAAPSHARPAVADRAATTPRETAGAASSADGAQARADEAPASGGAPPREPAAAAPEDAPARLDGRSEAPERRQAAGRPQPAAPDAGAELGTALGGIDRLRDDADSADDETPPGDEIALAESTVAPVSVPGRPTPRPAAKDPADGAAEAEPEGGPDAVEAEGSDVPPRPDALSDSALAAVLSPPPKARPARQVQPAAVSRARANPRIGTAAAGGALALDATSLIGVIDANSGREALLRTPSGDFLKVSRGDQVSGWRVSAIGQDAMRLTRGAESRTLLLVTR